MKMMKVTSYYTGRTEYISIDKIICVCTEDVYDNEEMCENNYFQKPNKSHLVTTIITDISHRWHIKESMNYVMNCIEEKCSNEQKNELTDK